MNNINKSSLQRLHNIVQNTQIKYPKELLIWVLRDYFSKDDYWHYDEDEWGFANIQDQTDLPLDAGQNDHSTTRIFIGEQFKNRSKFYPSILVKFNSTKEVLMSANREEGTVQYEDVIFTDSSTHQSTQIKVPQHFLYAGAWEGNLTIEVAARSTSARDELVELISIALNNIYFRYMIDVGLIVKPLSISGGSETQERNDYIYKQNISFDYRGEWRRLIPIYNLIERIVITVDFGHFNESETQFTEGVKVTTDLDMTDFILKNIYTNPI